MFPYSRSSWDSGPEMAVASRRWIGPADSWRGDGRWFSIERVISRPSPTGEQKGWQSTFQSHRAATGAGRQGGRAGRWQAEKFHFPLGRLSPKNQTQKKRIREKKKRKGKRNERTTDDILVRSGGTPRGRRVSELQLEHSGARQNSEREKREKREK